MYRQTEDWPGVGDVTLLLKFYLNGETETQNIDFRLDA
jgi:hypothetical protein